MSNITRLPMTRTRNPETVMAEWLKRVSSEHNVSYEAWAEKAGVSSTTITRFLRHGHPVPKATTLHKLAVALGLSPPELALTSVSIPMYDIPVISPAILQARGLEEARRMSVETTRVATGRQHCVAVRVTAETATLAGILAGDLVVVDPTRRPRQNDLVAVGLDSGQCGVYRLVGAFLLPQAPGNLPALSASDTNIIGVAVQVQRDL